MQWRRGAAACALLLGAARCSSCEPHAKPQAPTTGTHVPVAAALASSPATAPDTSTPGPSGPALTLASKGSARVEIYAPQRLFESEQPPQLNANGKKVRRPKRKPGDREAAQEAKRLLASVNDLGRYLSAMSGAEVKVHPGPAEPKPGVLPILVGELAEQRFGPPRVHALGKQGFRVVITPSGIGLLGESDLSTGYAIYELLDRLGCRWFMPGELGEEIPHPPELVAREADDSLAPTTLYRNLWYADDDFKRRNRFGGVRIAAGHMLEKWVSPAQREEHPDWRAQIKGQPHATRLRWSSPQVADAIANAIRERLAKKPVDSLSLSPSDGVDFDDTFDTKLDTGDWDPTVNGVSLTDRLLVLANRVASNLATDHPNLTLGLLAYVSYTRPPLREKVHHNVVPVIAPITYCRAQPWSDDACPGAKQIRDIVRGWGARADSLAFRGYAFNLAEPAAPNPMLRKWSYDLPFLFANKARFFQPETLPNFETTLPALYLGTRLSWNSHQEPAAIVNELFERFYGHASQQVHAYTDLVDRAWTETPEYSGGGLGYARRFTPTVLGAARSALDQAKRACQTDKERKRVALLDQSLGQLELYMQVAEAFRRGQLATIAKDYARWQTTATDLADKYAANSAFGKTGWAKMGVYRAYVDRFLGPMYLEADRIYREQALLAPSPTCNARYRLAPNLKVPIAEPPPELIDSDQVMDVCRETWSTIGQHDYFGAMWYQTELELAAVPQGKHAFVWLSKVDGIAQAWLNGVAVHPKDAGPNEAHLKSVTLDVTNALHANAPNRLSVLVQRTRLAELGAGGLLGPIYVYREP